VVIDSQSVSLAPIEVEILEEIATDSGSGSEEKQDGLLLKIKNASMN
jgi:hypothetical protein